MPVRVPRSFLTAIETYARGAYPEECCGFLLGAEDGGDRLVTAVRPARNSEPSERRTRYAIEPREVLAVERELRGGETILLGFYHSHPDHPPEPSERDLARAWPWYVYLIQSVGSGRVGDVAAWSLAADGGEFLSLPLVLE